MNFNDYQTEAHKTAIYPQDKALEYLTLGLCGEAGEFANKVKKILRGDKTITLAWEDLVGELGDIIWYWSEICTYLGMPAEYILDKNIEKLKSRQERNVLKGSGDIR